MTRSRQPEAMRMGLEIGVQSRVRHAEREWRRTSRARKRRQRVAATTAKTVWWRGNRYDVLGEDAHTLPVGGRILLRELRAGHVVPRMMPYIRLGRYRGDVVEDHGGSTSPLSACVRLDHARRCWRMDPGDPRAPCIAMSVFGAVVRPDRSMVARV